jgi:Zn-dependent M16 (insulinase) family peptidase
VYTAGSGGFLNILPVYMDHILYPLLREEDFMTEVHHISGHGEDSGVVYSEMQVSISTTFLFDRCPTQKVFNHPIFIIRAIKNQVALDKLSLLWQVQK